MIWCDLWLRAWCLSCPDGGCLLYFLLEVRALRCVVVTCVLMVVVWISGLRFCFWAHGFACGGFVWCGGFGVALVILASLRG